MHPHRGIVRTGRGDCAQYIERFRAEYASICGLDLYPGTLNVELEQEWTVPEGFASFPFGAGPRPVRVFVVPCVFMGEPAFVLRTIANDRGDGDHPRSIVEVASASRLRDAFELVDGDAVVVDLP